MDLDLLRQLNYRCLLELATEEGIHASGKEDVYGCVFGRDSALTILKIFRVYSKQQDPVLLEICRKGLISLVNLQGKGFNVETGEEPGKFIHEFRKEMPARLSFAKIPWFINPDGTMKNYDSIDSTLLCLIALYKYWQITQDGHFLVTVLSSVEAELNWIISYGDQDKDFLIEYQFSPLRKYGGLLVQSWTDSNESLRQIDGQMPKYPIAPVEVQGISWLALKLWGEFYLQHSPSFGQKLLSFADGLKKSFNNQFVFKDGDGHFLAQALDGNKNQIVTVTGNPLILLWATYIKNEKNESILNENLVEELVRRSFENDLFDSEAGIRTMSMKSPTFNPRQDSYHNGSFWPILNGLAFEGLENWGFLEQAKLLKEASLKPIFHFKTPIELYIRTESGEYLEYCSSSGQVSCKNQAWSAASILDFITF